MNDSQVLRELHEIERQMDKRFTDLTEKIHQTSERVSTDIAGLKAQSAVYGVIAGSIPSFFMYLFDVFKRG